jgi:hypothetical protein
MHGQSVTTSQKFPAIGQPHTFLNKKGCISQQLAKATALCANLKPRENFESGASRRFQNFLCTPQSLNRL